MIVSDPSSTSLSDPYNPSHLRPRHRREQSPAACAQLKTDTGKKKTLTSRYSKGKESTERMKEKLTFLRYVGLILILVLMMPDKANMNAENSVDLTTKHTKSLAHNFSSGTGTSNLRVPPKKRRKTRRGRNTGASAEGKIKSSNASERQDDRNISNANKEVREREGTMKDINQSDSNILVAIPNNIESLLRDVHEPIVKNDVPFFWHILKSGGTSVKDAIGMCLDLVEASESGESVEGVS